MPNSRRIAGLLGPTVVAMIVSEFPLVQPHLYDAQIPPVVYLSGVLMFVGALRSSERTITGLVTGPCWSRSRVGLVLFSASSECSRRVPTSEGPPVPARLYSWS
jgi:hypothetical protein